MSTFITNRDGNSISVKIESGGNPRKLAFVMHGLGGNKEEKQIRALVNAFIDAEYTVVTWDAVHTFGDSSGGLYVDATITH